MHALGDVTVLDLSHALAGPFASTMLGDYGAEIIKIEPLGGEIARTWGPPFYGDETAYFVNLNRNKKSVALDLKHPEGRALFFRLLDAADVVLENLRVGTVKRLGIDYAHARERQPRIVYCSVSGFGQDGPYRDRAALDLVVQAESGMMSITGETGGRGVRCGVSIADITAGMYAAFGIMTALHAREKTWAAPKPSSASVISPSYCSPKCARACAISATSQRFIISKPCAIWCCGKRTCCRIPIPA